MYFSLLYFVYSSLFPRLIIVPGGEGKTKKQAETNCCRDALAKLAAVGWQFQNSPRKGWQLGDSASASWQEAASASRQWWQDCGSVSASASWDASKCLWSSKS